MIAVDIWDLENLLIFISVCVSHINSMTGENQNAAANLSFLVTDKWNEINGVLGHNPAL